MDAHAKIMEAQAKIVEAKAKLDSSDLFAFPFLIEAI